MHWFWMNIPLAAMIFAVWTGVPLWLVLKHPDTGPEPRVPVTPGHAHRAGRPQPRATDVRSPGQASGSQLLAGAGK